MQLHVILSKYIEIDHFEEIIVNFLRYIGLNVSHIIIIIFELILHLNVVHFNVSKIQNFIRENYQLLFEKNVFEK